MKKWMKTLLICAAVCAGLGIALTGAGILSGARMEELPADRIVRHHNIHRHPSSAVSDESSAPAASAAPSSSVAGTAPEKTQNITRLDFELGAAEIYLVYGDDFALEVEGDPRYTSRIEHGEWELEGLGEVNFPDEHAVFTVTLPKDLVLDSVEISLGAGYFHADELRCRKAEFETGAGSVEIGSLTVTQECSIELGAGTFELANGMLSGKTEIDCSVGTAELTLVRPESYTVKTECSLGSVTFDGKELNFGSATDTFGTSPAKNIFDIECSLGTVTVDFS